MSEFSVETGKITNIADMLERQADKLENAGDSIDSVRNSLRIQGAGRARVMSAMQTTSDRVREESSSAARMGDALRQIAAYYRSAENSILRGIQTGNSGSSHAGGSNGNGGSGSGSQNGKNNGSGAYSKDPVNLNTGNFILDNHDMEIPGSQPLMLGRFYNSIGSFTGMLGKDWNTNFEMRLVTHAEQYLSGADICVVLDDGREEYFVSADGKKFLPVSGTTAELTRDGAGYLYKTLEGDSYHFDENGRYVRFENPHHIGFRLIYAGDKLEAVKKDSGESFDFSYDQNGKLEKVEDHTGRVCRYMFEDGHLEKVILPDGSSYQYFYNKYGKISRVLNPRKVGAVETEYDDISRVVFQRFADGTTNRFEYQDGVQAVVMTERNGSRSIHYHNEKYQNIRNQYADGAESFEYNERGQKTVITDKLGNILHLQYDNRGNLTGILTADKTKITATYNQQNRLLTMSVNGKNKVRNQYNAFGDIICSEDGIGRKTVYTYDEAGQLIDVKSSDKTVMHASYDERGNMNYVKTAGGGEFRFEYDELNQIIRQTNALGQKESYEYDLMGRLLQEIRADGCSRHYEYDEWGNATAVRDYDGSMTLTAYNENNNPVEITDAAGRKTYLEYDSMWNVSKAVLPNGGVLRWDYDQNNHLEMECDAEGNETRYSYDAAGNMLSKTAANGAVTTYEWDCNGQCIKVTEADGTATEFGYNEDGQVCYVKDAEGIELFRIFDNAGQLIEERDSLGRTKKYAYNMVGELISVIDERGHETSYRYAEGMNKIEEILRPDGTRMRYTYDLGGNVKSYTDIYGTVLYYRYDELNRLVEITGEHGENAEYRYDLCGRIVSEKDFEGNITTYRYSPAGQLAEITDALGSSTYYTYDAMDGLTEVLKENPDSQKKMRLLYERDLTGKITKLTDALGNTETYKYDCLGNMIEKVDRDQLLTRYTYNAVNCLKKVQWADGREAEYQYSPMRRLCEVRDWTGVTKIKYDSAGNTLGFIYPDDREMSFVYDAHGNRTQMNYPDGKQVFYEYDALDRLEKITQNNNFAVYTYNQTGNVSSRKLSNGSDIQYEYNSRGQLLRMTHRDNSGILDDFAFGYDVLGRRKQYDLYRRDYTADNGSYEYAYDPAGRLQQIMKDHQAIRTFGYDAFGNRSAMVSLEPQTGAYEKTNYEYDLRGGLSRLTKGGLIEEYNYDRRGNLTGIIENGQVSKKYGYDALNRLALTESADGARSAYRYNGLGYRVGMDSVRNGQAKEISYMLDYSRIYDNLLEKRENGESESYIWGNGLEGFIAGNGSGWYLTDVLGSVLRKSDKDKSLYVGNYDEFGNSSSLNEGNTEEFGYNGYRFDPIAGTYFAQARQYRSYTGLFDGMDRFGGDITAPDTINPYGYCIQDPINHTDKSGYYFGWDDAVAALIGAVGGAAGTFIGDVITSAKDGNWQISSWQEYAGAIIGGAAGGVTTLYAGPVVSGAVSGGVSTLTSESFTRWWGPSEDRKSWGDIWGETAVDTAMGGLFGWVGKKVGEIPKKIANTNVVKNIVSKMKNGGKIWNGIADKIIDVAHGKSNKQWSVLKNFLEKQHDTIGKSSALQKKLFSVIFTGLPVYLFQEIKYKVFDKFDLLKILTGKTKKKLTELLKKWLGLGEDELCAAAA